jgi:signal transduction histidine kinase
LSPEVGRRSVYFAFQGLLMAVLLLLALFDPSGRPSFATFWAMTAVLGGSLVLIQILSEAVLARWWFQAALFIGDGLAATVILSLTRTQADLYLIYLLIVFGSALTRSANQRLAVAGVTIALYLLSGWHSSSGWPTHSQFWLRALFLAVSSALLAVLARDSRQAQDEQRRRYEDRMIQVGRLATLGRVAGEVAHRIKGPLTTISVDAEVLAHRHAGDDRTIKELNEIRDEVERCKQILKDLLDLGRIEEMAVSPFDLRRPVRAALKSLVTQARRRRVRVASTGLDAPLQVRGDESLLQEAVAALLQNAIEAVRDGGRVRVEASSSGGAHRVSVVDDGAGIPPDELERVFEPFFTTKKDGSGLGLSAALRIAAKHGGSVDVESEGPRRGARFTLVVPAA